MAATKSMTRWLAGLLLGLFAATTAALLWVGAPTFVALLVAGAAGSVVLREAA